MRQPFFQFVPLLSVFFFFFLACNQGHQQIPKVTESSDGNGISAAELDEFELTSSELPAWVVQAVAKVRANGLPSTLPETELRVKLGKLLRWVHASYLQSGPLKLLPSLPEGVAFGADPEKPVQQHEYLKRTFWLHDNGL